MTAPVELDIEITELKQAIDSNDLEHVKSLMTRNPDLHRAPMGYGKNGPLTWVAECRIPWESPSAARLAMAQWMIDNGSDVHQGGDGPLMRAALVDHRIPMMELRLAMAQWMIDNGSDVHQGGDGPLMRAALVDHRIPMMELLVANGAEVNARWDGRFPIVDAPCETVEPAALKWLLDHGADSSE